MGTLAGMYPLPPLSAEPFSSINKIFDFSKTRSSYDPLLYLLAILYKEVKYIYNNNKNYGAKLFNIWVFVKKIN